MVKIACETVQQLIVYQWIKKTFKGDNVELILVDRFTILLKDGYDHALVSFSNDNICIRYSDRYDFKIEKIPFKKPYR